MIDASGAALVERFGQSHVLQFWNELTELQKAQLQQQLTDVDWNLIGTYLSELERPPTEAPEAPGTVAPPAHVVRIPTTKAELEYWEQSRQMGEEALREGKVGVVLLAGGQGTRLGFPRPKGMYPIGPVSGKSLFEIFAEQVIALSERVGRPIPYMIMTSDGTHEDTVAYFEQYDYFGLERDDVFFFKQGYAPCLDSATGKLLLADKGVLSMSPDGHGGILGAMLKAGLFDELRNRGVDLLFLHQVDNPLVKVCDPAFLGLHLRQQADVSIKVVSKTGPEEKVGVAVDLDGRTAIIEYSDLPSQLANEREANGELRYWAGSTAIHVFNRSFLEDVATSASNLPWHRARKKIPYVDDQGQSVQPTAENGVKFERFLFDTLPLAKTALIVETIREDEFAPLKNSTGAFSPDYVRQHMMQVVTKWFRTLGITIPETAAIEVSPLFAATANDLAQRCDELVDLKFDRPLYLGPKGMTQNALLSSAESRQDQPITIGP